MLLTLRLLVTPLFIATVTLAGRRWGPGVGGWLMSFPLVSGPISIILALQNGPGFSARAAAGTLSGGVSVCAYCLAYCTVSQMAGWPASLASATVAFLAVTLLLNAAPALPVLLAFAVNIIVILFVLWLIPDRPVLSSSSTIPAWDIPARMILAALFVALLTLSANALGPRLSGLFSPFPVISSVVAPFTHHQQGPAAARQLLRGVVMGLFAFGCFYLVVAALLPSLSIAWTYTAAWAASIAIQGLALRFVRRNSGPPLRANPPP